MAEKQKELTDEQIKEAIEKKRCPYCKSKKFIGDFPAWQRFGFNEYDSRGKPFYNDPDTSSGFEKVSCDTCQEEIPEIIWRKWGV